MKTPAYLYLACIPLHPSSLAQVVGLEPNSAMRPYAEANAKQAGFSISTEAATPSSSLSSPTPEPTRGRQLRLVGGAAEKLPFGDGSFDAVVCTLVSKGFPGRHVVISVTHC